MNYSVSFDVELDRLVPEQWSDDSSPHITCAAVFSSDGKTSLFYTPSKEGCAPRLSKIDAARLLDELWGHAQKGAMIISWGGTAVDFRVLHSALCGDAKRQKMCKDIVENHIDIPIASSTDIGMMMGLDAAAQGTGNGRKNNQLSTDAPRLWTEGKHAEVLEHVKLDAILTLRVYESIMSQIPPSLTWSTRSGRKRTWFCFIILDPFRNIVRLSTVNECLLRPVCEVPFVIPSGMNRNSAVAWLDNIK
jgi:hypothetical protein